MNLRIYYLKINVSCEACVNFQHISQNATLAMEFARCHRFTRPDNAIRKNTQADTSEVLRLPRDMTTQVSKVLRLPQNMQLIV